MKASGVSLDVTKSHTLHQKSNLKGLLKSHQWKIKWKYILLGAFETTASWKTINPTETVVLPGQFDWGGSRQRAPGPVSQPRPRCGWAAAEGWPPSSDSTVLTPCPSPACWTATCWWSGRAARTAGWSARRWPGTAAAKTWRPSGCAGRPLQQKETNGLSWRL